MLKFIYSVKDELVGFGDPVTAISDEIAIRDFTHVVNTVPQIRDNAKDFSLYNHGSFDSDSGQIFTNNLPVKVVDALSLLSKEVKKDEV